MCTKRSVPQQIDSFTDRANYADDEKSKDEIPSVPQTISASEAELAMLSKEVSYGEIGAMEINQPNSI